MSYELEFDSRAKKEWDKLDATIKNMFKDILKRRLENPFVAKDKLYGTSPYECYKIKLKNAGYRLVYQVNNNKLVLIVIVIGKREKEAVYKIMHNRINNQSK